MGWGRGGRGQEQMGLWGCSVNHSLKDKPEQSATLPCYININQFNCHWALRHAPRAEQERSGQRGAKFWRTRTPYN